jgi:hypothetical protein
VEIKIYEKVEDKFFVTNKRCLISYEEGVISCIHNENEKKLILFIKQKIDDSFYTSSCEILFCPVCGSTYQPERSKRKDIQKDDAVL